MKESDIKTFWEAHPCGEMQVGGLKKYRDNYEAFFADYDNFRYRKESHILRCLDGIDFKGKRTLEIGLGQGADAEQIIRRGAVWSGIDLTRESVERVRMRLTLRELPHNELKEGTALALPFADNSFDIIFSSGVLHHIPEIKRVQSEVSRVLRPDGELIVMLYAKWSLNYLLSISVARRLGLIALHLASCDPGGIYSRHLANVRGTGLWRYLKMSNFIHKNTDGPDNPYSKVYSLTSVKSDFPSFKIVRAYKQFMYAPPLPIRWLPLERLLGWHLWVHLKKSGK